MFDKLLYLPLDIENAPRDCLDKLNDVDFQKLIPDKFRNCWHVPIMEKNHEWMEMANEFPSLKQWSEDVLFPILGRSRISIITTLPGQTNPPHIDCSPKMFKTLQHKFRYVLQGNVDDLVFLNNMEDEYLEKTVDKPFIMSGKWPHYMINSNNTIKFTFAFGAPWDGDLNNKTYTDLLQRSFDKYKDCYLSFENITLPLDYGKYYERKYS